MNATLFLAILIIGFSAGLRTFTAPAVVAWCASLGCIDLATTPFSLMSSPVAVGLFSFLALGEYVWDLLPNTPSRTEVPGLIGRSLTGALTAACLLAATNKNLGWCVLGSLMAICGAFGGYQLRVRLVRALRVKDAFVAIPEDLIAIGLAILSTCLISRL